MQRYDVRGNVAEWCISLNPNEAVARGGAFDGILDTGPFAALSLGKRIASPDQNAHVVGIGFRVVLVSP
jgi:hypothetical protein